MSRNENSNSAKYLRHFQPTSHWPLTSKGALSAEVATDNLLLRPHFTHFDVMLMVELAKTLHAPKQLELKDQVIRNRVGIGIFDIFAFFYLNTPCVSNDVLMAPENPRKCPLVLCFFHF